MLQAHRSIFRSARRAPALAAAALLASSAVLASAAPAHALELNCTFNAYSSTLSAYCYNSGTTGTQFRARVGCAVWSGGYEVYVRYGSWRQQSGGVWSSVSCDPGHYVVKHGVAVR